MLGVLALPKNSVGAIRWTSLAIVAAQLVISLLLWGAFNPSMGGINDPASFQFVTRGYLA